MRVCGYETKRHGTFRSNITKLSPKFVGLCLRRYVKSRLSLLFLKTRYI